MESAAAFKSSGKFSLRPTLSCAGGLGLCLGVALGFLMGCGGVRSEVFTSTVIHHGWQSVHGFCGCSLLPVMFLFLLLLLLLFPLLLRVLDAMRRRETAVCS